MSTENGKDHSLWQTAKSRVGFRRSFLSYIATVIFMVGIWYFSGRGNFWPVWIILGWGIALLMQYFQAYHSKSVDDEYQKLQACARKKENKN
ncbi:MAG: 2TM domain-containing protein [Gammaproteobacteria bacterium]|nr:2TM domain-containing protein [Gammaproteobacteria bacterium]